MNEHEYSQRDEEQLCTNREIGERTFAQWLIETGRLDGATIARAVDVQATFSLSFCESLLRMGAISEGGLAEALATHLELPLWRLEEGAAVAVEPATISFEFLSASQLAPVARRDGDVFLVMADPLDDEPRLALDVALERSLAPAVGLPNEIAALIDAGKEEPDPSLDPPGGTGAGTSEEELQRLKDLASGAPVVRVVKSLVERAAALFASDIHIEPERGALVVRFRIDGYLSNIEHIAGDLGAAVLTRLKILAGLDIAEQRLPQDGRTRLTVSGRELDLRVSTVPMVHGEGVVLRLLDRGSVDLDFEGLGFAPPAVAGLRAALAKPQGIILVTGPTGSGKTSTLYAALRELHDATRKIITVEDPVEYEIPGINQIQTKPQIGLSFANVLRSILRHDPDIVMVGEIRDEETAAIAVQAALTGHLILATLHTNSAAAAPVRLLDMGIASYVLGSTLSVIVGQRLVRRLCPSCRRPHEGPRDLPWRVDEALSGRALQQQQLWQPQGCAECRSSGYRGRTALVEVLTVGERMAEAIERRSPVGELARIATAEGMVPLFDDGIAKVTDGTTSLAELMRVCEPGS